MSYLERPRDREPDRLAVLLPDDRERREPLRRPRVAPELPPDRAVRERVRPDVRLREDEPLLLREVREREEPDFVLDDERDDFRLLLLLSGIFTPDWRAFDSPMAIACWRFFTACLPLRAWCISSRTYSPAWVLADLPSRLALAALRLVFFSGICCLLCLGYVIRRRKDAAFLCAVSATVERPMAFHAVADDAAAAVSALRGHKVNRAFEAIKDVPRFVSRDLDTFVVFVSAGFASWHGGVLSQALRSPRTADAQL